MDNNNNEYSDDLMDIPTKSSSRRTRMEKSAKARAKRERNKRKRDREYEDGFGGNYDP